MLKLLVLSVLISNLIAVEKNDFTYKRDIITTQKEGLISVKLPLEVYAKLTFKELSDLGVYDALDQLMPHTLLVKHPSQLKIQEKVIPFASYKSLKTSPAHNIKLVFEGKNINLNAINTFEEKDYILDTSGMTTGIDTLLIKSKNLKNMVHVDTFCSNDLATWRLIKSNEILAKLSMQESPILKERLYLNSKPCHYLKLKIDKPLNIDHISAYKASQQLTKPEPQKLILQHHNNGIEFNLTKNITLNTLYFALPNKEQFYKLILLSKNTKNAPWHPIKTMSIYSLKKGKVTALSLALKTQANYYRIQAQENSYLPKQLELSFDYDNAELYFLAQGTAPYTLVYDSLQKVSQVDILALNDTNSSTAQLSREKSLNPNAKVVITPTNYKAIFTWIALILGVILLAFMTFTLIKDTQKDT